MNGNLRLVTYHFRTFGSSVPDVGEAAPGNQILVMYGGNPVEPPARTGATDVLFHVRIATRKENALLDARMRGASGQPGPGEAIYTTYTDVVKLLVDERHILDDAAYRALRQAIPAEARLGIDADSLVAEGNGDEAASAIGLGSTSWRKGLGVGRADDADRYEKTEIFPFLDELTPDAGEYADREMLGSLDCLDFDLSDEAISQAGAAEEDLDRGPCVDLELDLDFDWADSSPRRQG